MTAKFSFMFVAVFLACLVQHANSAKGGEGAGRGQGQGPGQGTGRYIIMFKPGSDSGSEPVTPATMQSMRNRFPKNMNITHEYKFLKRKGFSAKITKDVYDELMIIKEDEQGYIEDIVEDTEVIKSPKGGNGRGRGRSRRRTTPAPEPENPEPIVDVPWGLDRVDQRDLPLDDVNPPVYQGDGTNVHIYVIDTGIRKTHTEFEDRVKEGFSAINTDPNIDCDGHGTHVAGTAAGRNHGVAKKATLHSVQVLNCRGSGFTSDIIAGLDWIAQQALTPSPAQLAVASMSLGGSFNSAFNQAVEDLTNAGVVVVVAAGNSDADACNVSPASAPSAISVGATTISDDKAFFSNHGSCVDIMAPGEDIESAGTRNDEEIVSFSGTSMACPHVSGAAAILLGLNPEWNPSQVAEGLGSLSSKDKVRGLGSATPNKLLFIGA